MDLFIIIFLSVSAVLIAYAIYVETTKCKVCSMKYGHHKLSCPKNHRYMGQPFIYAKRNHEAWITCKECMICFDARQHGYDCPYCHTNNR